LTPEQRIKELRTLQQWKGSSMYVKLKKVKGKFHYHVYLVVGTGRKKVMPVGGEYGLAVERKQVGELHEAFIDGKYLVLEGNYTGQDPEDLLREAELIVGKWHCGKQIEKPRGLIA
jgi:hypothetical protein